MGIEIKKHYLCVLVADVDNACATATVIGASDRCEKAPARPRTRLRKDGGREERLVRRRKGRRGRVQGLGVGGKDSCHCQWVIRSVGQRVGRPLSISVLLAIYNTRRARARARRYLALSLSSPLYSLRPSAPAATLAFSSSCRLPGTSLPLRRSISTATGEGMVTRIQQREGNSNGERERDSNAKSYRNGRGVEAELPTRANRVTLLHARA